MPNHGQGGRKPLKNSKVGVRLNQAIETVARNYPALGVALESHHQAAAPILPDAALLNQSITRELLRLAEVGAQAEAAGTDTPQSGEGVSDASGTTDAAPGFDVE